MITSRLASGVGKPYRAQVTSENALKVTTVQSSVSVSLESGELAALARKRIFVGKFMDSGGSRDLNVDGSSTPVDFEICSCPLNVKSIQSIRLILHGDDLEIQTDKSRRFGKANDGDPLVNGIRLIILQEGVETDYFVDTVKVLGDFYTYADSIVNDKDAIVGGGDFFMAEFDLPVPVIIIPNSFDKIIVRIQDPMTELELFHVNAYGWQESLVTNG